MLQRRPELPFPADLYLEGSDQHRGWFQSSLLTSVAMRGEAPYRSVLTHGFTVDAKGRKMSKSLGNVIVPQKVIKAIGADILRLWVAATEYRAEMSISDEILTRMADSYRRIRNTTRYFLASLSGFDTSAPLPVQDLLALDQWALARAHELQKEILEAYEQFQFHLIYQKLHQFCVVDMGGFYLDILKDRMYTMPADSLGRRSGQTAMFHILEALSRWLAPVLSFTAEEIWRYMPGKRGESVFLETMAHAAGAAGGTPLTAISGAMLSASARRWPGSWKSCAWPAASVPVSMQRSIFIATPPGSSACSVWVMNCALCLSPPTRGYTRCRRRPRMRSRRRSRDWR